MITLNDSRHSFLYSDKQPCNLLYSNLFKRKPFTCYPNFKVDLVSHNAHRFRW